MPKPVPHKLKSGKIRWQVKYRCDGKVVTDTFATEQAGQQFCKLIADTSPEHARDALRRRRNSHADVPTLGEWTAKYLDPASGILTGIQPGTRAGYQRIAASSFLPILGQHPLDAITRDDIGRWVAWQEQQPSGRNKGQLVAAKTVNNYQALLSNIFTAAVERELIPRNPVKGVRVTKGQSREGVFLTPHEFARILEHVPPFYQPLVVFLVYTGARWGEATALTWGDVDLAKRTPTASINKAWKKGETGARVLGLPKSAAGRRTIPLNAKVVAYLPEQGKPGQLVFHGREGGPIWYGGFNTRIWRRAVEKADIGKNPNLHDLRHTYASWLLAANAPLNVVQRKLGHEKIDTTVGVYGHLAPGADDDVVRVLDELSAAIPDPLLELGA